MEMMGRFYENLDKIMVDAKTGNLEKLLGWIKEFGLTSFSAITEFFKNAAGALKDVASSGMETVGGVIADVPEAIAAFFQNAYAAIMKVISTIVAHLTGAAKAVTASLPATITVGTVTVSTVHLILGAVVAAVVLFALYKLFKHLKATPQTAENTFVLANDIFNDMPLFAENISKYLSEADDPEKSRSIISRILSKGKDVADNIIDLLSTSVDKLEGAAKVLLSSKVVRVLLGVCVLLVVVGFKLLSGGAPTPADVALSMPAV